MKKSKQAVRRKMPDGSYQWSKDGPLLGGFKNKEERDAYSKGLLGDLVNNLNRNVSKESKK